MILLEKNKEELGIDAATCSKKLKVYCQCDYCQKITLRLKETILAGRHTVAKDCCDDKVCMKKKRQESQLLKFGVANYTESEEFKKKAAQTNLAKYGNESYAKTEECKEKAKKTCLEKYGVEHYLASDKSKQERKEICLEKYGVEHYSQTEERQEKLKLNALNKWNVEHYSQTDEYKEKTKQTCLERYGVEYYSQTEESKARNKQTALEKYGAEHYSKTEEFKEKVQQTSLEKYGETNYAKTEEYKQKYTNTSMERYNCPHPSQDPTIKEKAVNSNIAKYGVPSFTQTDEYRQKTIQTNLEKYGVEYYSQTQKFKDAVVKTCMEKYNVPNGFYLSTNEYGKTEKEIKDFVNDLGFHFESDRTILSPKELDLYDPESKIAFEYGGLYFHTDKSPQPRDKNYHYSKYLQCQEKGIQLVTIFEDEWLHKKDICKNIIRALLKRISKVAYARECEISEMGLIDCKKFMNTYHLLGESKFSQARWALSYQGEVVGVLSLGKHHRQKTEGQIVLDRLCFGDAVIVGGASRLFHRAKKWAKEQNYTSIISWSDNRWSSGNVYPKMGFTSGEEIAPDYSYVDLKTKSRKSKQSQKKSNTGCPPEETENSWSLKNGLARIWDCGKIRWECAI